MAKNDERLNGSLLLFGFMVGLVIGTAAALFRAPKNYRLPSRGENSEITPTRPQLSVSTDAISESMTAGQVAARRRRAELGL
jgi:gas vesicle protein